MSQDVSLCITVACSTGIAGLVFGFLLAYWISSALIEDSANDADYWQKNYIKAVEELDSQADESYAELEACKQQLFVWMDAAWALYQEVKKEKGEGEENK